jgi:hypothetical protein
MNETKPTGPPPTRRDIPFDEAASTLQKAIRRGQTELAVRMALELADSGFDAYVWRRLFVICSEDVGLAEPQLPATVWALSQMYERLRVKRGTGGDTTLFLTHAVMLLARAKKSRMVDHALMALAAEEEPPEVPDVALDKHTKRGRQMGRGWPHFWESASLLADPETGELTHDGALPDPFRDRTVERYGGRRPTSGTGSTEEQLAMGEEA